MYAIAVPFVLFAFATQAESGFFKFVNYSTPEQCGTFVVNFSNPLSPPSLPLSLTIVPFSENPILIQLPVDTWDNSSNEGSARITFLPFSSGTQFVASLDDATGANAAFVSDVIAVKDSNVTACIVPKQKGPGYYHISGKLDQCSRFNVTFNSSVIQQVPSIHAFLPRYFSFPVNATDTPIKHIVLGGHSANGNGKQDDGGEGDKDGDDDNNNNGSKDSSNGNGDGNNGSNHGDHNSSAWTFGSKEYLLNVLHGFQTVLTFDDGEGHVGSSMLFTAGGTSSSPSSCFKEVVNIPSHTPSTSSSSSDRKDDITRTVKIVASVLGTTVAISALVTIILFCRKRRRVKKETERTSFVFTEEVDLGSSFVSRFRTRISQLTLGKRSFRSYRSYRDEKDGASTYVPTSPIGSPALQVSWNTVSLPSEKRGSWVEIYAGTGKKLPADSKLTGLNSGKDQYAEGHNTVSFPSIDFNTSASLYSTERRARFARPDVPIPAISRSSLSSRFLFGSGYISSRSSSAISPSTRDSGLKNSLIRFSVPLSLGGCRDADVSSSGYVPSRSSSASTEQGDYGIYISSPIRPSVEAPIVVPTQSPDSDTVNQPSSTMARDIVRTSRYPILKGVLRRDSITGERGRGLPFPITSLRASQT